MNQIRICEVAEAKIFFDLPKEIKVYLFGAGGRAGKFLTLYKDDVDIECILDNDRKKWGKEISGIKIITPSILEGLKSNEYKIIICVKKYETIVKQLEKMGTKNIIVYDV